MQNEEQEFNLIDYLNILNKYKKLIIYVLIISLMIGIITYLTSAGKYEVSMLVAIKDAPLTLSKISENINAGEFNDIIKSINQDPRANSLKVSMAAENLVKISVKTEYKKIAAATNALGVIYDKLNMQNKEYVEENKKNIKMQEEKAKKEEERKIIINNRKIDLRIELLNKDISDNRERIAFLEEEIKKAEKSRNEFGKEYQQAKDEYNNYIKEKEKYIEPKIGAALGLASYYMQIAYSKLQEANSYRAQIDALKKSEAEMSNEIKICKKNIENKLIEVKMASLDKLAIESGEEYESMKGIADIKLQLEPTAKAVKANIKLILMVSALGGLISGTVLAFLIESFRRIKIT